VADAGAIQIGDSLHENAGPAPRLLQVVRVREVDAVVGSGLREEAAVEVEVPLELLVDAVRPRAREAVRADGLGRSPPGVTERADQALAPRGLMWV
jgi:hypothetical protein